MSFKSKVVFFVIVLSIITLSVYAYSNWTEIANEMNKHLDQSYVLYSNGSTKEAKASVNKAYFGFYEKTGFERNTKTHVSGKRASEIEYQFATIKKDMTSGKSISLVRKELGILKENLLEDASKLDGNGGKKSKLASFISSLLIILREGLEAILVVAAMIAYLTKSGHKNKVNWIYLGIALALVASVILAVVLNIVIGISGAKQEIIEGVTMLIAVVVLFYVSNWMVKKAHGNEWKRYLEDKIATSITTGSLFSLSFGAFLAVFREGAETILFYQALLSDSRNVHSMVWLGLFVGLAGLVIVYYLIVNLSLKLPIKPFFIGTSILLYLMAISFAGTAIKELQEGDVIGVTNIPGMPTFELLGVYPTVQTITPQIILVVLAVIATVAQIVKASKKKNS